jgi:hypothetical protein
MTILPPTQNILWIWMHRPAFSEDVTIYIERDVYTLHFEDARSWFLNLCKDNFFTERVFSYLWNMRALQYFPEEKRFVPISQKEIDQWQQ